MPFPIECAQIALCIGFTCIIVERNDIGVNVFERHLVLKTLIEK